MILRTASREGYIATGVFHRSYSLEKDFEFFTMIGGRWFPDDKNEWGGGVFKDEKRHREIEEVILAFPEIAKAIRSADFNGEEYMVFEERDIDFLCERLDRVIRDLQI